MKKVIVLALAVVCSTFIFAQNTISESVMNMSKGNNNSFTTDLPTNDKKIMENAWKSLIKDYKGKVKYDKKSGEYFADDVKVVGMGANTVDIYAKLNNSTITVWYDLGGAYLSSADHSDYITAVETMLNQYGKDLSKELADDNLKIQEKMLDNLNDDLKKIEKEHSSLLGDIEKAKQAIAEAERKIEANLKDQEVKKGEIEVQADAVKKAKSHLATFNNKKN